jgi:TetR/AcrR family transcriptional repressor of nem operon
MARTKEFDPDAALQAALELFWRRGYAATTMADLVEHLGIARASIYATFGGKHDLYLKALDHYKRTADPDIVEMLSQPGPALPAVRAVVRGYAGQCVADTERRGCFIVNTAVELAPHDARAARYVEASWTTLETALTAALTRARAQGELGADADPAALARFLLTVLQGLRVITKGEPDPARLRDAAEMALTVLD